MKKVKIVLVNTFTNDYEKEYQLNVNVDTFLEIEHELQEFVEVELCKDEYGIYEYDEINEDEGKVFIQVNVEEEEGSTTKEDIIEIYKTVESKLENYLKDSDMI